MNAPTRPKTGKVYVPMSGIERLKKIVVTAQTDAPEEKPSVYGSDKGLLSNP